MEPHRCYWLCIHCGTLNANDFQGESNFTVHRHRRSSYCILASTSAWYWIGESRSYQDSFATLFAIESASFVRAVARFRMGERDFEKERA
eukprot:2235714-Pleurochrysis_carterae.AAC.2